MRMTYDEIAKRLGISGEAARQLVRRRGWRRIMPNHPNAAAIIVVPDEGLRREERTPSGSSDVSPTDSPDISRIVSGFEAALLALREAKDAEIAGLREAQEREIAGLREAHGRTLAMLREDHDRLLASLRDEHGRIVALIEAKAQAAEAGRERAEARAEQTERAEQFERARAEELTARLAAERRVQAEEMARLHHQLDEARAGEAELMTLRHAGELRRARGLVARLRAAWRGE
jgi:hypothetical protein